MNMKKFSTRMVALLLVLCMFTGMVTAEDTEGFTITFDAKGGECKVETAQTNAEGKLETIPEATREGYDFEGWYYTLPEDETEPLAEEGDEEAEELKVTLETVFTANTTVHAHWTEATQEEPEATEYTITLDFGNGTSTTLTGSSDAVYVLPVPTREGYTFEGWYDNAAFTGLPLMVIELGNAEDVTLYAKWAAVPEEETPVYTIYFNANGGYCDVLLATTNADGKLSKLPTPYRRGYVFDGWYYAPDIMPLCILPGWIYEDYDFDCMELATYDTVFCSNTELVARWVPLYPVYPPVEPDVRFFDVPFDAYYYDAVQWAVKNGITEGATSTLFLPGEAVTRAEVVTFLYRAAGCPRVYTSCSFWDVPSGSYYEDAVTWAVKNGITNGTEYGFFSPNQVCTRAEMVTFLQRYYAVYSSSRMANPFTDVSTGDYFYNAVLWAYYGGITEGTSRTTFSPAATCTRAQAVTFLYRLLK